MPSCCGGAIMSPEANKRLVRRFITEVINAGNLAGLSVFVADQIIDHNADPAHLPGIKGYKRHLQSVRSNFPSSSSRSEVQIAEGDLVVTQVTGRGNHQGVWLGIRPRGTPVIMTSINSERLAHGKIAEH